MVWLGLRPLTPEALNPKPYGLLLWEFSAFSFRVYQAGSQVRALQRLSSAAAVSR